MVSERIYSLCCNSEKQKIGVCDQKAEFQISEVEKFRVMTSSGIWPNRVTDVE